MKKLFTIIIALGPLFVMGQTSLLQDASGESAFKAAAGSISLNTQEAAVKLNFLHNVSTGQWAPFYGINLELKAKDGLAPVMKDGKFDPQGTIGGFYTFYVSKNGTRQNYITLAPRLKWSQVSLLDTANLFAAPSSKSVSGFSFEASFSRIGAWGSGTDASPVIFGLSSSFNVNDNSSDLGLISFDRVSTTANPSIPGQTLVQKKSGKGHNKAAFVENVKYVTLNADWGVYPKFFDSRILLAAHSRAKFSDQNSYTNLGIGFYLAKDGAPTEIVGGINYMFNDVFNQATASTTAFQRTSINLVVGFTPF